MPDFTNWKSDNYKFVGAAFDYAYNNRLNKLTEIVGVVSSNSIDYELTGNGGYGEMPEYDGNTLNERQQHRGFKTIITPREYEITEIVGYKQAKVDKSGECRRVGSLLGNSAAMTVYLHLLDMFGNAFNGDFKGGDGKAWAASDHPVASKGSSGRTYVADADAGTYSNLFSLALSVSAITSLQAAACRFITPDGLPLAGEYNMLLVSPEDEATAAKICGPNGKWRPQQAPGDNKFDANPLPDLQYMVIGGGSRGFASGQWALCDRNMMKESTKLVYITKPMVQQHELDNPFKDAYSGYVDFGCGWGDARQILFSTGA